MVKYSLDNIDLALLNKLHGSMNHKIRDKCTVLLSLTKPSYVYYLVITQQANYLFQIYSADRVMYSRVSGQCFHAIPVKYLFTVFGFVL